MGLTIHYTLKLKQDVTSAPIREMALRTADYARKIGCAEVNDLQRVDETTEDAFLFFRIGKKKDGRYGMVPPRRGWLVGIWPGPGCESAIFGLCQYPRRIKHEGVFVPTGFQSGWQFHSFCKTQYAAEHGLENFLQCHLRVISLLDFWRGLGVRVEVNDEGGYWKTRSLQELGGQLQDYDRLVAAMGGLLKDGSLSVKSPIFDYKNFERLEHEGWQKYGKRLEQLRAK